MSWWQSAAILVAVLTFLAKIERIDVRWAGDHVVRSYRAWGWAFGGALVIACALIALVPLFGMPPRRRRATLVISLVEIAVGGYLVAGGFGVVLGARHATLDLQGVAHGPDARPCEAGDRAACRRLVAQTDLTPGQALDGYRMACFHGGLDSACAGGALVLDAQPRRSDHEDREYRALVAHACHLDAPGACARYATLVGDGDGVPRPELAAAIALHACHLGLATSCPGGKAQPFRFALIVDVITPVDGDAYEPSPLLDDVETALAPCESVHHAIGEQPMRRVTVAKSGKVTIARAGESRDTSPELERCIDERFPAQAATFAMSALAPDQVTFDLTLGFVAGTAR